MTDSRCRNITTSRYDVIYSIQSYILVDPTIENINNIQSVANEYLVADWFGEVLCKWKGTHEVQIRNPVERHLASTHVALS